MRKRISPENQAPGDSPRTSDRSLIFFHFPLKLFHGCGVSYFGLGKGTAGGRLGVESLPLPLREPAVKMAVHPLRTRYREILREEIAHTVSGPEEIDEEIRQLFCPF